MSGAMYPYVLLSMPSYLALAIFLGRAPEVIAALLFLHLQAAFAQCIFVSCS